MIDMYEEWSVRISEMICNDRVGRGLAVVRGGVGYLRVGRRGDERMYLAGDAIVDMVMIGSGCYVTMSDAICLAMNGSLLGGHHADLLEMAVNMDLLSHHHHMMAPRLPAFITTRPWIHIDGISFPNVQPGDELIYVEDVYGHLSPHATSR
jgi:hypothetical protein